MGQSWHKALVEGSLARALSAVVLVCCGDERTPGFASSPSNPARTSEYFSTRIQSMIESRSRGEHETEVEAEIESSKAHWSELREAEGEKQRCLEADKAFFRSLQQQYVGSEKDRFFNFVDLSANFGEKIAEGAQGVIYRIEEHIVIKVFKLEGWSLEVLHKQWPPAMLKVIQNSTDSEFYVGGLSPIFKGVMLKDGSFGFVMGRYWGDLRKMIDERMIHNGNQASPFYLSLEMTAMYGIALGMRELHRNDIVHRDLKASNVLILPNTWDMGVPKEDMYPEYNAANLDSWFQCLVADFECSIATVGTRFWRAPEILIALKNRSFQPNLYTKKSDVYSFGMTCYEILTGKIPFEEERLNDYDIVLGGNRPELPSNTFPWVRSMIERCWHHEPSERPSFEEIMEKLEVFSSVHVDDVNVLMSKF